MISINQAIAQKQFKDPLEKVIVNLLYTNGWLVGKQNEWLKEFDLSIQQYNVLRILRGQFPKPASVNLLIERMLDKNSNSSRLVEKLRKKGLVDRNQCPEDRRQVDVSITEKGMDVLFEADKKFDLLLNQLGSLTNKEAETLSQLLDKLRHINS